MLGSHCAKTHSQTLETIALWSGESESYGVVKAATIGLGMKGLLGDLGVEVKVQVKAGSSAAKSLASRRGIGRKRHVEVRELWVQVRVAKGELSVVKVKCEEKVADGLTKHVDRQKMEQYVEACSMVRRSGGHELCPRLGDST